MPDPETATGGESSLRTGPPARLPTTHVYHYRSNDPAERPTADHVAAPSSFPDIPGYELLRRVGRGGMGVVYEARSTASGMTVALKVVYPVGRDEASVRTRFEREVKAAARISHPNIVPVYHVGEGPGFPYFTMKYIPGGTLAEHMGRVRADLPRAVGLVAKVARAVDRVHAAGVQHRDLKPLNILLGDGDEPLVADFGLAKFRDDTTGFTQSGAVLGTRQYQSPEQTLGGRPEYSTACDIWSLGVILYEVLTGRRPFDTDDVLELYRQIRERDPESCSSANPAAPAELDAVVRTCLAKDPTDRYPTAGAVADALEAWAAGGPVPPPPAPRRRRARRPRVLVAAGVAVLAGLAGGVAIWFGGGRPPARTPAERLEAGEIVHVIGPAGAPTEPHRVLDGSSGWPGVRPDGLYSLPTRTVIAVVLLDEPVRRPIRIEAEVAVDASREKDSRAGVFAGGTGGAVDGRHQVVAVMTDAEHAEPLGPGQYRLTETGTLALYGWNPAAGGHGLDRFERDGSEKARNWAGPVPAELRWHEVSVSVSTDALAGRWDDRRLVVPTDDPVVRHVMPVRGPGVGLIVYNAEGVFRNVRLVPE